MIKTESMKGNKGTTHDTGLLSGRMEAWKLKSLLLQLLLSIGEKGHIVPNKTDWFQQKTGLSKRLFIANVTEVIIAASSTALEFSVMLRAKTTTPAHLQCLDYMEQVTHYHHIRLQILKRILFHKMKTGETVVPNIRDIKGGNKEHYFFHYKEAIKQLGPDVRLWDTEHSEKLHQPAVKEAHRKSSKRYDGKQMSMALKYKEVDIIKKYKGMITKHPRKLMEDEVRGDIRIFEASDSFSSNSVRFDTNRKEWRISGSDELLHFHPLLTPALLHKHIDVLYHQYSKRYDGTFDFHLMEKIKINESNEKDGWMLRCSQHHNRNYHMEGHGMADYVSIWNAVSCNVENFVGEIETRVCLVLCIVYMEIELDNEDDNVAATFVIVSPMEDCGETMQLPFEHLKLCKDGNDSVVVEALNAKNRIVEPVFICTIIPYSSGDYDTDYYDIPFDELTFVVIPYERMTFPSLNNIRPSDLMALSPKIFVSYDFLRSEQTRLLLDYDLPDASDTVEEFVDMIDADVESVMSSDFEI